MKTHKSKLCFLIVVGMFLIGLSCGPKNEVVISKEKALQVANSDIQKYLGRNVLEYLSATAFLKEDGWHVEYALINKKLQGGGAHYIIDLKTGEIKKRRLEQ